VQEALVLFKLVRKQSVEKIATHLGVMPIEDDFPNWIEVLALQPSGQSTQYICNTERGMMLLDADELWQNMDYYKKSEK
jgi:hypothetical protein